MRQEIANITMSYSDEVERYVLSLIMANEDLLYKFAGKITAEHFYSESNRLVFGAIVSVMNNGGKPDIILIGEELKRTGDFEKVGGYSFLSGIVTTATNRASADVYLLLLHEKYITRTLTDYSAKLYEQSKAPDADALKLLDSAEEKILQIGATCFQQEKTTADIFDNAITEIAKVQSGDESVAGVPSGFVEYDRLTNGFRPGTLTILAARPAMGKSALACGVARNIAVNFRKSVLLFSLEMTANDIMLRLISAESNTDSASLRRAGAYDIDTIGEIRNKAMVLRESPLNIVDKGVLTTADMFALCRKYKMIDDLQIVFVDYLQLLSAGDLPRNSNREQQISYISRQLKALSQELNIPVVALSQLSRAVEQRADKRPILSDLRESGAIEQDADVVAFLYRPEYYKIEQNPDGTSTKGLAYVDVAKNRSGETGTATIGFDSTRVRFYNLGGFDDENF